MRLIAYVKLHTVKENCKRGGFSVLFGFVFAIVMRMIGNYGLTNALATGWISIGNLWMMSGLLVASRKVRK